MCRCAAVPALGGERANRECERKVTFRIDAFWRDDLLKASYRSIWSSVIIARYSLQRQVLISCSCSWDGRSHHSQQASVPLIMSKGLVSSRTTLVHPVEVGKEVQHRMRTRCALSAVLPHPCGDLRAHQALPPLPRTCLLPLRPCPPLHLGRLGCLLPAPGAGHLLPRGLLSIENSRGVLQLPAAAVSLIVCISRQS